jgi:hypothetical protein
MGKEVKEMVTDQLNGLAANFYDDGIVKLEQDLDKCVNSNGDHVLLYLVVTLN